MSREPRNSCRPACLNTRKAPLISMLVNLVLVVLVLSVTTQVWKQRQTPVPYRTNDSKVGPTAKQRPGTYCFKLSPSKCDERGYIVKPNGNETLCCADLRTHLYHVMAEALPQRLQSDSSKDEAMLRVRRMMSELRNDSTSDDLRPAAHLGILTNGNLTVSDNEVPRIEWEQAGERSLLTGDLVHLGDRIVVSRAGYYFLYTSLQFTVDPATVSSAAIVSYVFRDSNNSQANRRKLMMARESSCQAGRGPVRPVSVYMAGIFLLYEKDEISVRTASHSLLVRSPATSYMGIHLI